MNVYIRLIPISEQIDTKVVTQYILRYKFLIKIERIGILFNEINSVKLSERH